MSKPSRGTQNQQVGRAGELFVAAELNKRGAIATLYLTSTPRVDVVATDPQQHTSVSIQVKTKSLRSKVWQANIRKLKEEAEKAGETDFIVFVDLRSEDEPPRYYVCGLREFAARHASLHDDWLEQRGKKFSRPSTSAHTAIKLEEVEDGRDRWDLLAIFG